MCTRPSDVARQGSPLTQGSMFMCFGGNPRIGFLKGRPHGRVKLDVPNFCSHSHPPAETAETVFRVNPIWPIAFHCLRHTSVSTPHENTPGPHIPAGFWKWVGPRRQVRGRKGSAWATSGGSVWIWKSTPLSAKRRPMKHHPNSADRFDRNRRNGRNVFGAVCFARTGVSGRSVSVRRTS